MTVGNELMFRSFKAVTMIPFLKTFRALRQESWGFKLVCSVGIVAMLSACSQEPSESAGNSVPIEVIDQSFVPAVNTVSDYVEGNKVRVQKFFEEAGAGRRGCWASGSDGMDEAIASCLDPSPNAPNVLVLGDAHAAQMMAGLRANFPNVNFDHLAANSCPLVAGFSTDNSPNCAKLIAFVNQPQNYAEYDAIILKIRGVGGDSFVKFAELAKRLSETSSQRVILIGPNPQYSPPIPSQVEAMVGLDGAGINRLLDASLQEQPLAEDRLLAEAFKSSEVEYFSIIETMCSGTTPPCNHMDSEGWPILVDASNMSVAASVRAVGEFRQRGLRF